MITSLRMYAMERNSSSIASKICESMIRFFGKCIFYVLSVGPMPRHIAFIMDGNRRYARKINLTDGHGHRLGFLALMDVLKHCYGLGVKYVTIYAFSIDNFKRRPEEVQSLMDLLQEKIEGLIKEESIVNCYGIKVNFIGNLKLLSEPVRLAAKRVMLATAKNSNAVLSICIAYTSTNEIIHAVQESCEEKWDDISVLSKSGAGYGLIRFEGSGKQKAIECLEIENHMYMAVAPDPEIIIRSSGENRLSNFLLWQSASSLLYSPSAFWPEIGFSHIVWAILNFQRKYLYIEKKSKQL